MDQYPPTSRESVLEDGDASTDSSAPVSVGDPHTPPAEQAVVTSRERIVGGRPRRFLAWLVDYLLVIVPGVTVVAVVVASLVQNLPAYLGAVAAKAGWSRVVQLFTQHRAIGFGHAAVDEWVEYALPLLCALVAVPMLQFAYLGIMGTWRRRTIGMLIADVRLDAKRTRNALGRGAAVLRAAAITFVETGLIAVALVLMVLGQFALGLALWGAAVVLFWANAVAILGPSRRTIIDRLAGAVVVRHGTYAVVAHSVSATVAVAGRKAAQAAVTAGRAVSDVAAVTGDLARQGGVALSRTAPVRQVRDSRAAAQAQAIGAAGLDRAREFGEHAADRARELRGRGLSLWRDRRVQRGDSTDPSSQSADADTGSDALPLDHS